MTAFYANSNYDNAYIVTYDEDGNVVSATKVPYEEDSYFVDSAMQINSEKTVMTGDKSFAASNNFANVTGTHAASLSGTNVTASGDYSVTISGLGNEASGEKAVVISGQGNTASGKKSIIIGGHGSFATGEQSVAINVIGPSFASGYGSTIVGGFASQAGGLGASVFGGQGNTANDYYSVVVGGQGNTVNLNTARETTANSIFGGYCNTISGGGWEAIFGGGWNSISLKSSSPNSGFGNVIIGGNANEIKDVNTMHSVIIGGSANEVRDAYAVSIGGRNNIATGGISIGGFNNTLTGSVYFSGGDNLIIGGANNSIANCSPWGTSFILGGNANKIDTGTWNHGAVINSIRSYIRTGVSTILGGENSYLEGMGYNIGINGGSTTSKADHSTALGHRSLVSTAYGTAIGYQATTDEDGTIAFGHDVNDAYLYADYDSDKKTYSKVVGEYKTAYYNRLVKIAYGQDEHDAVVMAQLPEVVAGENVTLSTVTDETTGKKTYTINAKATTIDTSSFYTKTEIDKKLTELNVKVIDGKNTTVTEGNDTTGSKTYAVNVEGNGKVEAGDKGFVTGDTVYNITKTLANTDLTNITEEGTTVIKNIAQDAVKVIDGKNTTVTEGKDATGAKTYAVNVVADGKAEAGNTGLVSGDTLYKATLVKTDGSTVTVDKDGTATKVDVSGATGDRIITGVKTDAADDSSAVNVGYLKSVDNDIRNQISDTKNYLNNRINKAGAGAAALAALHPLDFDPDDKLSFAAGFGNYAGQNAAAIGAFYRPNEDVMFSISGTAGNGENMVNAGVSFTLGGKGHVTNSRTAMAKEIVDLRGQVAELKALVMKQSAMLGTVAEEDMKLFPDIPKNHWAYEYIGKLAAMGSIDGYPDGNFHGDRMMTRYEFAAMLYRAMQNGAQLSDEIFAEFEPELGRIRVDRIRGGDDDPNKIERVRVNGTDEKTGDHRDNYGSKIKG